MTIRRLAQVAVVVPLALGVYALLWILGARGKVGVMRWRVGVRP